MAILYGSSINLGKNELQNARIQNLSSAPSTPVVGQIYFDTTLDKFGVWDGTDWQYMGTSEAAGDVSGPASSVDSEVVLFSGTTGKLLKRMTGSGLVKVTSGVASVATAGTDYSAAGHTHTASSITDFDTEVANNTDVAANTAARHTHSNSTVLNNTTASFTTADETKLDHITVTQAVDLDTIETRVNALDAAVVLKGTWDASAGTFPGSGSAQAGDSYIVSVGGTVNSVAFSVNDRILAITDNASTGTYASNWFKLDYTDQVLSVAGQTGAVTLTKSDVELANVDNTSDANKPVSTAQQTALDLKLDKASNLSDVANAATAFGNIKQAASTTATGVVELATTGEAQARSSSSVVVTPAGLADFTRGYAATIGDGSTTNIVVTHSLGTQNIVPSVRDASTNAGVEVEWEATSTTTATFKFATAPATNAYKVVIVGL